VRELCIIQIAILAQAIDYGIDNRLSRASAFQQTLAKLCHGTLFGGQQLARAFKDAPAGFLRIERCSSVAFLLISEFASSSRLRVLRFSVVILSGNLPRRHRGHRDNCRSKT
jgi:hypothetical protein